MLFPHVNVVNRFTPVVADISNMGYGVTAATINLHKDIIPNRFNVKLGGAKGFSTVAPQNGGKDIGTEINAALRYNLGPFMSVELHGAHLWLGDFFESNDASHGTDINGENYSGIPSNPWTAFITFKWLMF